MSPQLKPLLLPKLVEERRKRESILDQEIDLSASYYAHNSSASDIASPVTPTFSPRGAHLRYPSSVSSMELPSTPATDSPPSPSFAKSGKRSLPDVQEDPQEREDFDMFDDVDELYDCFCDSQCVHRDNTMAQSTIHLPRTPDLEYDLTDGFFSDSESAVSPRSKKRRAGESPFASLTTRLGTRFPSFSRSWLLKKEPSAVTVPRDTQKDVSSLRSRGASSRSSSISNAGRYETDVEMPVPPATLPSTPKRGSFEARGDSISPPQPIDIEKANTLDEEEVEKFATTPLLPPLMIDASANYKRVPMQSPLQSPSVAETGNPFVSSVHAEAASTPHLPSPPLSSKPSVSSFHHSRPGHLVSSDIPPIVIADIDDEWANKLGHANFTINPEPYLPATFDIEACRQLRQKWDLARCNYTKHLVRTGEHYGVTSTTYRLTEEKWSTIDAEWRRNNEATIANTVENGGETVFASLKHNTIGERDGGGSIVMTKIPSLGEGRREGKFPLMGDTEIVGPMIRYEARAQLQRSPSTKKKLFKFIAEKFPVGLVKNAA